MVAVSTEENEVHVLAVLMHRPDLAARVFARVPVEQFDGKPGIIAQAIHGLRVARKPVDVSTVIDEMRNRSTLGRVDGPAYVHRVWQHWTSEDVLTYHLDAVANDRRIRKLVGIGHRLTDAVGYTDVDAGQIAHEAAERIQNVIDGLEAEQEVTTETLGELLASQEEPYDWVIPGLLERADRLILTGTEGAGKSTLFRQIAVCVAAGLHPFTLQRIEPQRVLYMDLENSRKQARRSLRGLSIAAKQAGLDPSDNLFIECRPGGIDITRPEDELWFISRVVALQPAILFTGPIYKMHEQDPNDEKPARKIAAILDRARAAANCSIVIETHTPHGTEGMAGPRKIRPVGTSMWLRWPEFGYGIRPTQDFTPENRLVEFVPWRGDREERDWPTRLKAGGTWPWQQAADPNATWTPQVTPYPTPDRNTA